MTSTAAPMATNMPTSAAQESEHLFDHTNDATGDAEEGAEITIDQRAARRFFRRPRAGRACGSCHSRRVRCDAGSHGIPCTNCNAFSLKCNVPQKNKKREGKTAGAVKTQKRRRNSDAEAPSDRREVEGSTFPSAEDSETAVPKAYEGSPEQPEDDKIYAKIVRPEPQEEIKQEIEDPGRVAYLEEFSNMSLMVNEYQGPAGVHFPLPKASKDTTISTKIDDLEMRILRSRGALSLPPAELCDELIQAYFTWIAPIVPIINQTTFMQRYHDPENPPSLLLMQAILLAGSRVCATPLLLDSTGSASPAATVFYNRAKALYDADYEEDRVIIVQALILMGWYWEDPGKVPKNVFYWNGLAVAVAQGCGMHRSTKESRLSISDQRLWTRIWWTLYTRDRSVAAALGRPTHIKLDGSDIEMVCEQDFIEDENLPPHSVQVQFFLQYVKLCEIMDLVLFQNYSISPRAQQHSAMALTQCDMALAEWLQYCPAELRREHSQYNFWSSYLQVVYNTTCCLLHRAHLPPAPSPSLCAILTRSPAYQSAHTITAIVQELIVHDDLRHAPPFIIYSMLSALMVHIYHLHTAMPAEVILQQDSILLCMDALERLSELWLVGKMVRDLFETVLAFEDFNFQLKPASEPQGHDELILGNGLEGLHVAEKSQKPNTSLKLLPLTSSLVAHMGAALKSASSTDLSEGMLKSGTSAEYVVRSKQELWNHMRPLAPHSEYHGFHQSTWMDQEHPSTTMPTGFDATEWFQFFGIQ